MHDGAAMTVVVSERLWSVLGKPRPAFSQHAFRGGNFLVPGMLSRFAVELDVRETDEELTVLAELPLGE